MTKHRKLVTIIKRSCITGKVVWIYRGVSHNAGRHAYWKACKAEIRRIRQWTTRMAARQRALMQVVGLGDSSSSSSGIYEGMTPEQQAAVKEISKMSRQPPPPDREFYNHIVEESRRRNWQSNRWKENRTKMIRYGKYK